MPLSVLPCTGQLPRQRCIWPLMSVVLRSRIPDSDERHPIDSNRSHACNFKCPRSYIFFKVDR